MEYVLVVKTEKLSQFISGRTGLITESNAEMMDIIRAGGLVKAMRKLNGLD